MGKRLQRFETKSPDFPLCRLSFGLIVLVVVYASLSTSIPGSAYYGHAA